MASTYPTARSPKTPPQTGEKTGAKTPSKIPARKEGKMVERKLFAGARVRRLRRELRLTQAAMAEALGVSTSYLNLIERDQRPISAQVLLSMVEAFNIDPRGLAGDEEARAMVQLHEVFADPFFQDTQVNDQEIKDIANASPAAADAIARLFQTWHDSTTATSLLAEQLADNGRGEKQITTMSHEEVRDFINHRNNHFPALDEAAEKLFETAGLNEDDPYFALRAYLNDTHRIKTRIATSEIMGNTMRRYDHHRQTIFMSELLDQPGRCFQLAYQLAYLEQRPLLEDEIANSGLENEEAKRLGRKSLANYFAAALLMPYDIFQKTAEQNAYDITLLGRRFGTSFEQVCHRLTTLQRPGAKGLPFFLIRVDNAGNISKRFSAAGFHFSRFGGTCPRWHIHDAFRLPGKVLTQIVQMEDRTRYFSVTRSVGRSTSGYGVPDNQFAIGLGCEITHAPKLTYARGHDFDTPENDTPIGINCRMCMRVDCQQRATPPLNRPLKLDENTRGLSPFDF